MLRYTGPVWDHRLSNIHLHFLGQINGSLRGIIQRHRRAEQNHQTVAKKPFQCSPAGFDKRSTSAVK
jgi:hypothetical protein